MHGPDAICKLLLAPDHKDAWGKYGCFLDKRWSHQTSDFANNPRPTQTHQEHTHRRCKSPDDLFKVGLVFVLCVVAPSIAMIFWMTLTPARFRNTASGLMITNVCSAIFKNCTSSEHIELIRRSVVLFGNLKD
jgi:hypothetical protein